MHRWHYIRSHHIFHFILFDYCTNHTHSMQHWHSQRHYQPSEYSWHNRLSAVGNVIFCLYVYIRAQNVQLKNNIIECVQCLSDLLCYGMVELIELMLLLLPLSSCFHCLTFPCTPKVMRIKGKHTSRLCAISFSLKWCILCDVCARSWVSVKVAHTKITIHKISTSTENKGNGRRFYKGTTTYRLCWQTIVWVVQFELKRALCLGCEQDFRNCWSQLSSERI